MTSDEFHNQILKGDADKLKAWALERAAAIKAQQQAEKVRLGDVVRATFSAPGKVMKVEEASK